MTIEKFYNDTLAVTATINSNGTTTPTQLIWRGQKQTITSVGRQWDSEAGRHILIEVGDGTRYELQLSRADLVWRVKRTWPVELAA